MSASTPTAYTSTAGSVEVDSLTKQILTVCNRLVALPKFGNESEEPMTATQGSYRPYTSYSGSTHMGCGAVDLTPYNWKTRFMLLDLLGAVPFHRTPSQGNWPEHIHIITDGMGCESRAAQGQVTSAKNGRDGLRLDGPDPDKARRSGIWPLAVYQGRTGLLHALKPTSLRDGPSSARATLRAVAKGEQVNAIMEVRNNHDNLWFVTDKGEWGFSEKWAA